MPPLLAGWAEFSFTGTPIALAQARLISPSLLAGPPSATTASTLLPFWVFVTTALHPITTPATPLMIIGGTTTYGTVAASTYLNGDEFGSGLPSLPGRWSGNRSPRTWIPRTLDNGRAVGLPRVGHDAKEIPHFASIPEIIEGLALKAWRCITGRAAELTVRAVSVELRPREEGHALVGFFYNIATFDVAILPLARFAPAV